MIDAEVPDLGSIRASASVSLRNTVLAALIVFAIGLRLLVRLMSPHLIYVDEIYQSIEQTYRLLFGTGIIPWEFEVGIRSWLVPGILAPFMWLGHQLGPGPDALLLPIKIFMAAASTTPVICGFLWGERFGGLMGAIVTGALSAMWVDNIYFSTHPLSEVLAADTLVVALYLCCPGNSMPSGRRLFWGGLLFGLTFALRFHLGPAILVALAWIGHDNRHGYKPLLAAFLVPVCLLGLLDWITWSYPFQSVWLNIWINLVKGVSGDYGVQPQWYFFIAPLYLWGGACALIAALAFAGSYRLPLLLIVSFVILATMSVVQHKEYRFIYPAIPLVIILAGLGTTECLQLVWEKFGRHSARRFTLGAIALCFWSTTCIAVGTSPSFRPFWTFNSAIIAATEAISSTPEICGVALYNYERLPLGQASLPSGITLDEVDDRHLLREASGFNAILTEEPYLIPDTRFRRRQCWSDRDDRSIMPKDTTCLWVRQGVCKPGVATQYQLPWPKSWRDSNLPKAILARLQRRYLPANYQESAIGSQK